MSIPDYIMVKRGMEQQLVVALEETFNSFMREMKMTTLPWLIPIISTA